MVAEEGARQQGAVEENPRKRLQAVLTTRPGEQVLRSSGIRRFLQQVGFEHWLRS